MFLRVSKGNVVDVCATKSKMVTRLPTGDNTLFSVNRRFPLLNGVPRILVSLWLSCGRDILQFALNCTKSLEDCSIFRAVQ